MGVVRLCHRYLAPQAMPSAAVGYYEKMSEGIVDFYLKPLAAEINRQFDGGTRILDVGTGTGHLPVLLARENERLHITGIDLSAGCIRSARERAARAGVDQRVKFVCGQVSDLRDDFDLVVSTCSFHHWRHPVGVLRQIVNCLRSTGQLWLLDDSGDISEDARKRWVARVESSFDAGFLFRTVFNFESRHLAYKASEIRTLCRAAGLEVIDLQFRDVFFTAKCQHVCL